MWLMDCKEFQAAQEVKLQNQTKLRPLMPRPIPHCSPISAAVPINPNYWCLQNPNFPPWNRSPSCMADYGMKREMSSVPLVSSRWNPTPEQLQALEEMYRRGIRTPSAEQIQQIAGRLRRFGKIEGKNVFYWFQNHKARERQRKRRHEMELLAGKKIRHVETSGRRRSGLSSSYIEIEHPKKLPTSNNSTPLEYCVLDNEELQQQAMAAAKGTTEISCSCCCCWQLELSSSYMSPNHSMDKFAGQNGPGQGHAKPFVLESGIQESQTLELFPVKATEEETNYDDVSGTGMSVLRRSTHQFFEFLPTKSC